MTRPKHKPRYRIKRTDIFSHPKTRGMRTGSYAIMDYAMAQNILGLIRESPKFIAANFEGFTASEFNRSLRCLVLRNVARWWPEYDIIWIIEALDEQSFSSDADYSAAALVVSLPDAVQEAVRLRYGDRVSAAPDHTKTHWVYFAQDGAQVKIGCSANPWARVNALRAAKRTIRLLAKERGDFKHEKALHDRFSALQIQGEWYSLEGALADYIAALPALDGSSPGSATGSLPQKSRRAEEQESLRDSPPTPSRGGDKKTARTDSDFALVAQSLTADSPTASPANDLPGEESLGVLRACEPAPSKPRRGKPRVDYPDGLDEHLLAALQAACRSLTPPLRGPRKVTDGMRDLLRKLWAECEPTREDVDHVVAVRAAMTRRGERYGSLTWDSICVASNFRRWLAERPDSRPVQAGRAEVTSRPTQSGVVDIRAARAAAKEPTP